MVTRVAAGVVAGLLALAAGPAVAQEKVEKKADQAETAKKLEAEIAKLRAMEEALNARLKQLRAEVERLDATDRVGKNQIERQIDDAKMQAEVERQRARAEFERATRVRDEELRRAEIEFNRAANLRQNRARLVEEVEKAERVRDEQLKLAQVERDRVLQLRDEQLKRVPLEQQRAQLQDERKKFAQREVDRLIELKFGEEKPRVIVLGAGDKAPVPYEKMSAEELKQVITKLQMLLDEKTRGGDKPGGEKVKSKPQKPAPGEKVKPGSVSQDEILKRLDKLSQEVEELRRAIKK